jgi:hypothetical protein
LWYDDAYPHVILSTARPLRDAYLWYDGALTLVILSERVRERVEGSSDGARIAPTFCETMMAGTISKP